jgi:transcriptional regulator with PAS, ATPase and Fis domain
MIGQSAAMQHVFEMIECVAATEANVMITGESGTGKELVARSIHTRSNRNDKPFIPVNCSAFPESLFEAELFGYEKGAFTGASRRKSGLLEYAHKGSFFLDEVCELSGNLQAKLLRVLQEKKLRRIGSNRQTAIDVRLISATNRDPEAVLSEGVLRQDFYFRINVVNIHLPPLRDRREDIHMLAEYFLSRCAKSSPKTIKEFDEAVIDILDCYDWPGNVRELENTVERAVALTTGDKITSSDLPPQIRASDYVDGRILENLTLVEAKRKTIAELERKYLLTQLSKHSGNVTEIAKDAGMTRRNVHRMLQRHGLDAAEWRN